MSTIEAPRSRRIFLRLVPVWAGLNWLIGGILTVLTGPIALAKAGARKIRFCLLLRHGNFTSGLEWEKRRGTCF